MSAPSAAVLERLFPPLGRRHTAQAFKGFFRAYGTLGQNYGLDGPNRGPWIVLCARASLQLSGLLRREARQHPLSLWKRWERLDNGEMLAAYHWTLQFNIELLRDQWDDWTQQNQGSGTLPRMPGTLSVATPDVFVSTTQRAANFFVPDLAVEAPRPLMDKSPNTSSSG